MISSLDLEQDGRPGSPAAYGVKHIASVFGTSSTWCLKGQRIAVGLLLAQSQILNTVRSMANRRISILLKDRGYRAGSRLQRSRLQRGLLQLLLSLM